ncbi:Protease 1 precursor [compost metagenome]
MDNITSITPNDINSCEGENLTLSSILTGSGISTPLYTWQFSADNTTWTTIGANATTLALNNVQLANSGYYKLTVSGTLPDNTSCSIVSQVIKITISIKPVIAADNNKTILCPGEATTLRISNGAKGKRYRWFIDGGSIEIPNSPDFITINEPGSYLVRIENDGCSLQSEPIVVIAAPLPTALFTYAIDCTTPATVSFTNTSSITDGSILSYSWDFGDGTPAVSDVNPVHTYTSAGSKKVILTVTSSNGCAQQVYSLDIVIAGANNLQAQIIATQGPFCVGNEITFNDASTKDFGVVAYRQWKVNNAIQTETGPTFKFTPLTSGDYTISMSVGYNATCGAISTATAPLIAVKPNAISAFSTSINCITPATVAFTNTSSIDDGSTLTYTWDFGDGTPALITTNKVIPSHTYTSEGNKTITLSVAAANSSGCSPSVVTHDVTIVGADNLQAVISIENPSSTYCAGNEVVFRDASTHDFGTINYRQWTVNGVIQTETGDQLKLTPNQNGSYNVDLEVGYTSACPVTASTTIQVNPSPVALFTTTIDCSTPATVAFDNQSSISDNSSLTYTWNFGDGTVLTTADKVIPAHTYTSAGVKTVTLSVAGASGCVPSAVSQDVTIVGANNLQAAISIENPTSAYCVSREIVFRDVSTRDFGAINYRQWIINGVVQTETGDQLHLNPNQSGSYQVDLAVGYTSACPVTTSTTIQVNPNPVALFSTTVNCSTPSTVAFDNQSSISDNSPLTYAWDFGDGATLITTDKNTPAHTYSSLGEKIISLIVTADNSNCNSIKYEQKVTISGSNNLTPQITPISSGPYCVDASLSFKDDSKVDFGTLNYRKWEINGVEQTEKGDVLTFTPIVSQDYVVRLTVGFSEDCPATPVEYSFSVNAKPTVSLASFSTVCENDPDVTLTGGSPANGDGGTGYYTIDGGTQQVTVFSPQKAGVGVHTIKYTFINGTTGCENSAEQTITVGEIPAINCKDYSAILGIDLPLKVELSSQGTDNYTYSWSPTTGLSDPTIANPVLTPSTNVQYTVTVANGSCTSSCVINITVLPNVQIPNVFTPNGDGMNDNWVIAGIEDYPGMEVYIYDRYGSKLYYTKGYSKPWDGLYNGKNLPAGTYYYVFKPNQHQLSSFSGAVTIMY